MIRVILDASVIATYATREPDSMSVSELIAQVEEGNDVDIEPAVAFSRYNESNLRNKDLTLVGINAVDRGTQLDGLIRD